MWHFNTHGWNPLLIYHNTETSQKCIEQLFWRMYKEFLLLKLQQFAITVQKEHICSLLSL